MCPRLKTLHRHGHPMIMSTNHCIDPIDTMTCCNPWDIFLLYHNLGRIICCWGGGDLLTLMDVQHQHTCSLCPRLSLPSLPSPPYLSLYIYIHVFQYDPFGVVNQDDQWNMRTRYWNECSILNNIGVNDNLEFKLAALSRHWELDMIIYIMTIFTVN